MKTLDYQKVFSILVEQTKEYLETNNLKTMVLGISGGIDSTVVAAICHEVSNKTGIPLIGRSITIESNPQWEIDTSILVGKAFCSDFKHIELEGTFNALYGDIWDYEYYKPGGIADGEKDLQTPIADGNIKARLRMIYLYNLASIHNGIVFSTDNQTEYQLGFWTLHGDVGDFNPLFGLWKTEVYGLAAWLYNYYRDRSELGMAEAIYTSMQLTPTDGLGISSSDLEQIGAESYEEVDGILRDFKHFEEEHIWDKWKDGKKIGTFTKRERIKYYLEKENLWHIDENVKMKVLLRHANSDFKRQCLPVCITRKAYEN